MASQRGESAAPARPRPRSARDWVAIVGPGSCTVNRSVHDEASGVGGKYRESRVARGASGKIQVQITR